MTGNIRSLRPARAAIAAVLAFSSPALLAQTVVPPAEPVVAAPEGVPAPISAPNFAPPQPVVQQTPSVEERLDAALAASEAEKSSSPVAVKRAAPTPVAKTQAEKTRAEQPIGAPTPAPRAATPAPRETAPVAPPPVQTAAPVEPAPVISPASPSPAPETGIDPALPWALGGGALLMIGLGGMALLRRRKWQDELWVEEVDQPVLAEPVAPRADAMPLMTLPPVSTPASSDEERTLEAMVAAPPSPENPFRTQAKRRTRAKFLLRQQGQAAAPPLAPATVAADSPRPVPTSTQTVYRFGQDRRRENLFKPRTS
ncbi:hypothetical protein Sphch_2600 [Sphingobium chlorophenolicum L-1]|uniref:LPXTG-motif cell wall anchor domain protein n=1 Tax=Sphingobium chlorophenolicum L-1 TaxID=690566 RepID=F6EZR1_SPHCR|nr:hypothetical protein [Sphingobium chlorophenolicum]AEG50245.1 hypothetical protein Sphch_2600 [Sphingobium chlorophenolicum L-1]